MFVRKYIVPTLALAGLAFALYSIRASNRPRPFALPVAAPSTSPFAHAIAGSGIVEASSRNIAIGTNVAGIVTDVFVRVSDRVAAGDPLFKIDDRSLSAQLALRSAALEVAQQNFDRLAALPRPEDVPPAQARVAEMSAMLADMQQQLERMQSIQDPRAVSAEDLDKRRFAVQAAQARLDQSAADLALLNAGAWKPDLQIARAHVLSAQADVDAARTEIDRLTVRAPIAGSILQLNLRPGEFAPLGSLPQPLILLGSTDTLHVRVDIDENDAWRLTPSAPARATIRGNSSLSVDLAFAYIEPFVIPKRSLTGDSTERVDTRVLQVLYAFPADALPVYVGQQLDVFIEAPPNAPSTAARDHNQPDSLASDVGAQS